MDSFVGDDNSFVSLLVFPSVSSLAPIMLMSMPNLFCVSVLFPLLLGSSSSSSMELSPKDLSSSNDFSSSSKKVQLVFLHRCSFFVLFPDDVQPSYISAHDYPLCMNVQEPVHISRMIICISNKHACFPSIVQLGSHLFAFMYGNHCHFSKCSQASHIFCVFSIKQCMRGFVLSGITIMLSNFVAVEMTSHQNSPLPFESIPAWISMALALPINVGIHLSATAFC